MSESPLRLVRRIAEFMPKDNWRLLPRELRGIYVLYVQRQYRKRIKYDVLYIGMAAAGRRRGLQGRLRSHARSKRKGKLWTHFSAYEVWDNIRDDEVTELEGLLRHIFRKDSTASSLNIQRGFRKARRIRVNDLKSWHSQQLR